MKTEHIFDLLYAGYGINISKSLISKSKEIIILFQCADMHNSTLSSR